MLSGQSPQWVLQDAEGHQYCLSENKVILGKDHCAINLQLAGIDKHHCQFSYDKLLQKYYIRDLSTTNGTFINGQRIPTEEEVSLNESDQLKFGTDSTIYTVRKLTESFRRISPGAPISSPLSHYRNMAEQSGSEQRDTAMPSGAEAVPAGAEAAETPGAVAAHTWKRHEKQTEMAECPMEPDLGCVAEQGLHHTCGETKPEQLTVHSDNCVENSSTSRRDTNPAISSRRKWNNNNEKMEYSMMDSGVESEMSYQSSSSSLQFNYTRTPVGTPITQQQSFHTSSVAMDTNLPGFSAGHQELLRSQMQRSRSEQLDAFRIPNLPLGREQQVTMKQYYQHNRLPVSYSATLGDTTYPGTREPYLAGVPHEPPFIPPGANFRGNYFPSRMAAMPSRCATCEGFMNHYGYVPIEHLATHQAGHHEMERRDLYGDASHAQWMSPPHRDRLLHERQNDPQFKSTEGLSSSTDVGYPADHHTSVELKSRPLKPPVKSASFDVGSTQSSGPHAESLIWKSALCNFPSAHNLQDVNQADNSPSVAQTDFQHPLGSSESVTTNGTDTDKLTLSDISLTSQTSSSYLLAKDNSTFTKHSVLPVVSEQTDSRERTETLSEAIVEKLDDVPVRDIPSSQPPVVISSHQETDSKNNNSITSDGLQESWTKVKETESNTDHVFSVSTHPGASPRQQVPKNGSTVIRPSTLPVNTSSSKPDSNISINLSDNMDRNGTSSLDKCELNSPIPPEIPNTSAQNVPGPSSTDNSMAKNNGDKPGSSRAKAMAFTVDLDSVTPKARHSGPPLAFTVDFGEGGVEDSSPTATKGKKFAMNASLSEFLPSKVKKSVKDRAALIKKKEAESPDKSGSSTAGSPCVTRKSLGSQRGPTYQSDGAQSASSDGEDISFRSDVITTRSGKANTPFVRKSLPARGATRTLPGGRKVNSSQPPIRRGTNQYGPNLPKKPVSKKSSPAHKVKAQEDQGRDPPSELDLYHEAKLYNSMIQSKATGQTRVSGEVARGLRTELPSAPSEAGTYTVIRPQEDQHLARQSIDQLFGVGPDPWAKFQVDQHIKEEVGYTPPAKSAPLLPESPPSPPRPHEGDGDTEAAIVIPQITVFTTEDPPKLKEINSELLTTKEPASVQHSSVPDRDVYQDKHDERGASSSAVTATHDRPRRKLPTPPVAKSPVVIPPIHDSENPSNHVTCKTEEETMFTSPRMLQSDSSGRLRGSLTLDESDEGSFMVCYDAPSFRPQHKSSNQNTPRENKSRPAVEEISEKVEENTNKSAGTWYKQHVEASESSIKPPEVALVRKERTFILDSDDGQECASLHKKDKAQKGKVSSRDTGRTSSSLSNTETVFRSVSKTSQCEEDEHSDDSTQALVDITDKPTQKKVAVKGGWRRYREVQSPPLSPPPPLPSEGPPPLRAKSVGHAVPFTKVRRGPRLSQDSEDGFFRATDESDTASTASTDFSGAVGSPKLLRGGSAGKGSLSIAKTNRTFMLRRQKNNSSPNVPQTMSATTPARPGSARRVQSQQVPRARTAAPAVAASFDKRNAVSGQLKPSKSRDGPAKVLRSDTFTRKDTTRRSLNDGKSSAQTTPQSSTNASPARRPLVAHTRQSSMPVGRSSTSSTTSNTRSGTSPSVAARKAEELAAWKRRKSYNPREAIAQQRHQRSSSGNRQGKTNGVLSGSFSSEDTGRTRVYDEVTMLSSQVASGVDELIHRVASDTEDYSEHTSASAFTSYTQQSAFHTTSMSKKSAAHSANLLNPVPVKPGSNNHAGNAESYDPIVIASVHQLSKHVKDMTHKLVRKASELQDLGHDISPIEDMMNPNIDSANPDLMEILHNLKSTEHRLQVLDQALFSHEDVERQDSVTHLSGDTDSTSSTHTDPEIHQLEVDRIRAQAGFRPISNNTHLLSSKPSDHKTTTSQASVFKQFDTKSHSKTQKTWKQTLNRGKSYGGNEPEYY